MSLSPRRLVAVLTDAPVSSRTVGDRLELLTALIAAPGFDPLFRPDAIAVPGDHPVYGWKCGVPVCPRSHVSGGDLCKVHTREWKELRDTNGEAASLAEFLRTAKPTELTAWLVPLPCRVCPDIPAWTRRGLCYLHGQRWHMARWLAQKKGVVLDFELWLAGQPVLPSFGQCLVETCPETAGHALGLCQRHRTLYQRAGRPGGVILPHNWGRMVTEWNRELTVSYRDEAAFRQWCRETGALTRENGKLSLLGLRPLIKAEFKWCLVHHMQVPGVASHWPLSWIQRLVETCRQQKVNSLADLDLASCTFQLRQVARVLLRYLRQVYFTREDTKEAGFLETDHFGVRFSHRDSFFDLSSVSQRWLRDLLWDWLAARLTLDPPRSGGPFDQHRRGCVELSAFLEIHAPGGGHDPTVLTAAHAVDFVADQRHRAQHALKSLGIHRRGRWSEGKGEPGTVTAVTMSRGFNGLRHILRDALESGRADQIGLDRGFIVTIPPGRLRRRRRSPFTDNVAQALADPGNLRALEQLDREDRGSRDIWETLVLTGRRCGEVLEVRLECLGRLNGLPMFWHDQTKVGNFDQAIRIPERLYERLEKRQKVTIAGFVRRNGRPPTPEERRQLALFPRRNSNRNLRAGLSYGCFNRHFRTWLGTLDITGVPHQARHTLATNLLRAGADLTHVKRYLGQVSEAMAEHYVHLANTDPRMEQALQIVWVAGPGSAEPGLLLSAGEPMSREEAESLAIDLSRRSTPADGGFCTFQPVVSGEACPFNLNCHSCDKFVMSGADLLYWHRKREQWRMLAERAPDPATADYLHDVFEPTARAIEGLERALAASGLLEEALALDLRRPQDYFGRVWATAFRAADLAAMSSDENDEAA